MLGQNAGNCGIRTLPCGWRISALRIDPEDWHGFAPADLCLGTRTRLAVARTDPQSPITGRHLRSDSPPRGRRGALMQAYLTLTRRELGGYFVSRSEEHTSAL